MEEVQNNTGLAETIKSQEVPLQEIPKDRPYIPIEEMFNTPEYDEWISSADVAQIQQLQESKLDIDKYSPAAMANLGIARPSQATTTFDPVAQQNPPTLEEEGGFTRLLNEMRQFNGLTWLGEITQPTLIIAGEIDLITPLINQE